MSLGRRPSEGSPLAHRSLAWLASAALAVSLVGLVVVKVFADNTPPYDEPLVALIGFAGFMLGMLAFLGFGAAALVRELRARRADESPNQHLRLDAGAAAVILATTQIAVWWGPRRGTHRRGADRVIGSVGAGARDAGRRDRTRSEFMNRSRE